jgi:hypothetical protein
VVVLIDRVAAVATEVSHASSSCYINELRVSVGPTKKTACRPITEATGVSLRVKIGCYLGLDLVEMK